jgi:hypothetical protein
MKYWAWITIYLAILLTVSLLVVADVFRWTAKWGYAEVSFILVWLAITIVLTFKGTLRLGR